MRCIAICLVAAVLATLGAAMNVGYDGPNFCNVAISGSNDTLKLGDINPATYNGSLVGVQNGEMAVSFDFSWCLGTTMSPTCNASNYTLTMTTVTPNMGPQCVVAFNVIQAPPIASSSTAASMTLWSQGAGALATVTINCDPNGVPGTATLKGNVVQPHIYSYLFTFSSVHACATNNN